MWCQHCGAHLGKDDETCPRCGRPRAEAIPAEEPRPQAMGSDGDEATLVSAAPVAPAAPWVTPSGPPPTLPASSTAPAQPSAWPAPPAPPSEEPTGSPGIGGLLSGVSRRHLMLGGAIGVVGVALGAGGGLAYNQFFNGAEPLFWAYPTASGGGATLAITGATSVSRTFTPLLPGAATVVASQRPSASYLAVATRADAAWQVAYWTANQLQGLGSSAALPAPAIIAFTLPPGRQVAQIYDLRVFPTANGDAAIAVAMTDSGGIPQIAYFGSLAHPASVWRMPVTPYTNPATEVSIVGPDTLVGGKTLYARVSVNGQAITAPVDVTTNLGPPPATPTPKPRVSPTTTPKK